jgi:hypothetical protein
MFRITLTRQQLYDRVWVTPTDTLARELGLSGRGCQATGETDPLTTLKLTPS